MIAAGEVSVAGSVAARRPQSRRHARLQGVMWLAAPGIGFLALFFLLPIGGLLSLSLQDPRTHHATAAAYVRLLHQSVYLQVLGFTLLLGLRVAACCLVLGYPLAYWLARLSPRRRNRMLLLVLLPFWTSALIKSFTWLVLLGRTGVVAQMLLASGLAAPPVHLLYSDGAVTMAVVHALLPLAVMTMLPVMMQIDPRLSRAAHTLGASRIQAFWRIAFPLSMPGVAAAGLLVFISTLGFFIAPVLIGGPQQSTIASLIVSLVETMLQWNFAAALAMLLVGATLLCCGLFAAVFGLSTLTGQRAHAGPGRRRWFGRAGVVLLGTVATLVDTIASVIPGAGTARFLLPTLSAAVLAFMSLPALSLIPVAFTSSRFISFPPPGYSLQWMEEYLGSAVWMSATLRSFVVGLLTGLVATAVAALAAYAVSHSRNRWAGPILALFLGPMIVPHVVTALGLFYLLAWLSLVGTDAALVIGHTVLALPLVFVTQLAAFRNYDWSLDRAAATLGANRFRVLLRVTVPLIRGGLAASFLLAFIASFEELTVAIFVSGGLRTTLPKQLWDDTLQQVNPTVAAASVVVMAVVTCLFLVAQQLRPAGAAAHEH